MSFEELEIATRRHTEFGDAEALQAVIPVACKVLCMPKSHDVGTLRLAAQAVVLEERLKGAQMASEVARACGRLVPCWTNKVLRNKQAGKAQYSLPACENRSCNMHCDHHPGMINAALVDQGYSVPDEYIPVGER